MANEKNLLFVVLLFVAKCYGSEFDRCPSDSRKGGSLKTYNSKCYQFVPTEVFWHEGRQYCLNRGGDLITIHRRDIQVFVEKSLKEIGWQRNGIWIGATDMHDEENWKWVTGENVRSTYQNWDSGQPSCFLFKAWCLEDCACLRLDEGYKWHDYFCAASRFEYGFICQYDMLPLPTVKRPNVAAATLKAAGNQDTTTRKITTVPKSRVTSPKPVFVTLKDIKATNVDGDYAKADSSSLCHYGNKTYKTGARFPDIEGCNTCHCYNGNVGCTEMACITDNKNCYYGNVWYNNGAKFKVTEDCNWCVCNDGQVNCSQIDCNNIGSQIGVHSHQVSSQEDGMKTGSVVGMVVAFLLVFIAGIIIGLFLCKRRYKKRYEETASAGFSNVLYTVAPQQTEVKQTSLYMSEQDSDLDEDPPHYTSIDNICVPPPYSEAAATGSSIYADVEDVTEVKKVKLEDADGGDTDDQGLTVDLPPAPCGMELAPEVEQDLPQQPADGVSEAYSNNLYGIQ